MGSAGRRRGACLFVAVVLAHTAHARESAADDQGEPIRFEYSADPVCPTRDEALRRLATYTTRWTLASEEATRKFDVRVERRGRRFRGVLELRSNRKDAPRADTIRRTIEADDCDDVVTGVAIAVALAIDPRASLTPRVEVPEPPPSAPAPAPPVETAPSSEPAPPPAPPPRALPPPAPRPSAIHFGFGARAEANAAVSGVLADVGLFAELAWNPPSEHTSWFAPALRLGGKHSFTRTVEVGATDVDIDWMALFFEGCPIHVPLGARFAVGACVTASVGSLAVEARNAPNPDINRRLWLDYGGLASARWFATPKLFFELTAGVTFPILRDRFRVEPGGLATLAPPLGWTIALGGGWRP